MIAVCIATYNQQAYLAQAIESVLAQVCDEPIRIYIGDDASQDCTGALGMCYGVADKRVVFVQREKNIGLAANTIDLYRRILEDGCEYIAMLDGDDYWTDEKKLQLQVDYLRSHSEVGFVHTGGRTQSGTDKVTFGQREGDYGLDSVGFVNCTVLFRASLLNNELLDDLESQHFMWLDYPLYGVFYQQTKWAYLPQETAVWRDHVSVSQPRNARKIMALREERVRMWRWLDERFPGQVGYDEQEAQNYLYEQRLNLIYQFNDRRLVTPALVKEYKPRTWKQWIKQKGAKNRLFYIILRKFMR